MANAGFEGIKPAMLEYFMGIAMNNYREYFLATKKEYERDVKQPLYALAEELMPAALYVDGDFEQRPSRVVSRIRRDTRFTKDKTPYRSHMWLSFYPSGTEKSESLGLYYSISLTESCYGMGYYHSGSERARWLREKMLRQQEEFLAVLTEPAFAERFVIQGENYKRMEIPEQLDPRLHDWYCKKSFCVEHTDGLDLKIEKPEYAQEIAQGIKLLKPLYDLLMTP